jgi:ribosomal protein S19E (S16A)
VRAATARAAPEQTAAQQAWFVGRVAEVARQLGHGSAGKLQLLQLEGVREELGERWAEIADRVRTIAEQVLTRRLARVDVFAPIDDGTYLILFAELAEDEARLRVAALAREIRDRLLGELGPSPALAVSAFVVPLAEVARGAARDGPTLVELDRALSEREDVAPPPDTASQAELRPRLGEVGVSYRPMLYTKTGMISVFGAQAMRLAPGSAIERGLAAYPSHDPPVSFEIDRAVLQHALKDARRLVRRAERALVTVPLRLQSLIDHSAGQLVDLCRTQRPAVRRLVVLELVNLLPDAPTARLGEAIPPILPFCRAVIISVPPTFAEFERAAWLGVASVGIELAPLDQHGAARVPLVERLAGFAAGAHAHGMTAHLHGVADRAVRDGARAAGFDYVNGPAIVAEAVRPVAMYPYAEPSDA